MYKWTSELGWCTSDIIPDKELSVVIVCVWTQEAGTSQKE